MKKLELRQLEHLLGRALGRTSLLLCDCEDGDRRKIADPAEQARLLYHDILELESWIAGLRSRN